MGATVHLRSTALQKASMLWAPEPRLVADPIEAEA
jgi:hypothetical protein